MSRSSKSSKIPPNAERVFSGVLFDVYQWEQELYDGSKVTFERLRREDSVVVFPVLKDGKILLVEDEQPGRSKVITAPSGRMDEGESPEEAAKRELLEETGYECDLYLWKSYEPSFKIDWTVFVFIGKNCEKVQEPNPGGGELIKEFPVTLEELLDMSENPIFQNKETATELLKAKYDQVKMAELKKLLFD